VWISGRASAAAGARRSSAGPASLQVRAVCIISVIQQGKPRRRIVDFIRDIQARDWVIAVAAFLAGAFIF
jgi:hypothetical protein